MQRKKTKSKKQEQERERLIDEAINAAYFMGGNKRQLYDTLEDIHNQRPITDVPYLEAAKKLYDNYKGELEKLIPDLQERGKKLNEEYPVKEELMKKDIEFKIKNNIDDLMREARLLVTKGHPLYDSKFALQSIVSNIDLYDEVERGFNDEMKKWILQQKDNPDSKFADICLQLQAFQEMQAALKKSPLTGGHFTIPLQIAMDHAIKDLKKAPLYASRHNPKMPSRVLQVLSFILVIPIAFAAHSAYKHRTMYYVSSHNRKQTAEKALEKFKNKQKEILNDAPNPRPNKGK